MKALPLVVAALVVTTSLLGVTGAVPVGDSGVADSPSGLDAASTAPVGGTTAPVGGTTDPAGTASDPRQVSGGAVNESTPNATIHVLDIPGREVRRTTNEVQMVDLGPAVGFAANSTRSRVATLSTVERIQSANTSDERQRLVLGELNRIEQETITLRSDHRALIEAFGDGELSSRAFLIGLARIDAQASVLEERRQRIATLAQETPDFSLSSGRLAALERELSTLTGPVRATAVSVLRGELGPTRFYVATGNQSVVLTTIVDDGYVREAFRGDLRDRGSGSIDPQEVLNVTAASYPTVWEYKQDTQVVGAGSSYLVQVPFAGGKLTAFVDSGSGKVFKEFQHRPLEETVTGEAVSRTRDGLVLTINRSYPGAPLRVTLADEETGRPVDANITIAAGPGDDSTLLGATGEDGVLWTLTPQQPFTVTAVKTNSVVFVEADPATKPIIVESPSTEPSNSTATRTAGALTDTG